MASERSRDKGLIAFWEANQLIKLNMNKFTKTIAGVLGFAVVLSLVVVATAAPAKADTISDLQAQIASLTAQLSKLSGSTVTTTSGSFNTNLTVGSKGADVVALQNFLIKGGYAIAAGATGNFGPQTKAALAAYQAANAITPAAGYFGPITRAKVNAAAGSTTVGTGSTGSTSTGSTAGVSPSTNEGILTATAGPISNSVLNVGQQKAPIMTVRINEQNSDIAIQRIQLNLGTNTNIYNKVFQNLYAIDASTGNVLATVPLNSSTVVQSGSNYITNISIPNFVVKAGTYKDITIAADIFSSIDSVYRTGGGQAINPTISVNDSGVRGVDGTGTDQYSSGVITGPTLTINASLVDNSIANISLDSSSPSQSQVAVTDTTNGQYLKLPVLVFDLNAQNDAVHLHNLAINVATSGTQGTVTAAYLYQGSTQVASAAVSGGVATFSNITDGTQGALVAVNSTLPYTVKVDATGVLTGYLNVTASFTTSGTTIYNSQDGNVAQVNGSATGYAQKVVGLGLQVALSSANLVKTVGPSDTSGNATTTYSGTFNLNLSAVGTDATFGLLSSSTPSFATSTSFVTVYANGAKDTTTNYLLTVNYSQPTGTTLSGDSKSFTLGRNNSVTIPVTYTFAVKNPGVNTYAVQLEGLTANVSSGASTINFFADLPAWRTNVQ